MKNVCNFDLAYDIFLHEQKYLHQVSLYIFAKKNKKRVLDMSKNIQINLIKNKT